MNTSSKKERKPDEEGLPNDGIHRPNVEKLASYIDGQTDPMRLMAECEKQELSNEERKFLRLVNDTISRRSLLARLEQLGLLSAFLAAENGTT